MGEVRNVNQVFAAVNSDLQTTDATMQEYRQTVANITSDIDRMNKYLDDQIEEIFQEVTPKIASWDEELAEEIKF